MISKHFTKKEFACKCGCGYDDINQGLVDVLDDLRDYFNKPVIVNSGCRCTHHNYVVGGKSHSYHLVGRAADIRIVGVPPSKIYKYLDTKYPDKFGILCYDNFVHIDVRISSKTRMSPIKENEDEKQ